MLLNSIIHYLEKEDYETVKKHTLQFFNYGYFNLGNMQHVILIKSFLRIMINENYRLAGDSMFYLRYENKEYPSNVVLDIVKRITDLKTKKLESMNSIDLYNLLDNYIQGINVL